MSSDFWLDAIARLSPHDAIDIDPLIGVEEASGQFEYGAPDVPPTATLWARDDGEVSYIGIRVTTPGAANSENALRLAAAAAERKVVPIILSHVLSSGFENFGFRVEFIAGASEEERMACEAEIARFWDIPIVIDVSRADALR